MAAQASLRPGRRGPSDAHHRRLRPPNAQTDAGLPLGAARPPSGQRPLLLFQRARGCGIGAPPLGGGRSSSFNGLEVWWRRETAPGDAARERAFRHSRSRRHSHVLGVSYFLGDAILPKLKSLQMGTFSSGVWQAFGRALAWHDAPPRQSQNTFSLLERGFRALAASWASQVLAELWQSLGGPPNGRQTAT